MGHRRDEIDGRDSKDGRGRSKKGKYKRMSDNRKGKTRWQIKQTLNYQEK